MRRAAWLGLLVVLAPAAARADFKEWSLALTPAYSMVYVDTRTASGGGGGLDVGFGVSESLAVHASGFVSWHSLDGTKTLPGGTLGAFAAMVGLSYTLDVIRLVPAFQVSVGALGVRGGGDFSGKLVPPSTAFGVALGFTLDYLVNRHVGVGLDVKYHALVTDLTRIPIYLYVGPRVVFRFGG